MGAVGVISRILSIYEGDSISFVLILIIYKKIFTYLYVKKIFAMLHNEFLIFFNDMII